MALGLTKTKRRIASIRSTQKITKAMEMVATVKLKRYRDALEESEEYANGLAEVMAELFLHDHETRTHYAFENEEVPGTLYLIITSSLGLCAGYNGNVYKFAETLIDPEKDTVIPLGEKGRTHYGHDPKYKHVDLGFPALDRILDSKTIDEACREIKAQFNQRKVRKVVLIYTKYVNSINFAPAAITLLPVNLDNPSRPEEAYCPPIFEPDARVQIHQLLPYYLGAVLFARISESILCEQASRRNAMDTANDNADDLLNKLTIEYNKARQTAITQEITEVVSGSSNATN